MKRSKSISITCFLFVSCLWGVCAGDGPVRITVNIDGGADFTSIQEALDSANSGDEIRVAPGTYNEAINFLGKAVHLYSSGGPSATIIDAGGLNASVVTCNTGENPDTILEGFTLTGGNSFSGGGMSIHYSSPTVKNCLFTGNSASTSGGGMYTIGSSPTVINSIFIENATEGFGGGMFNTSNSAPILINCTFTRNSGFGGGIVNWLYSTPALTNCIVWGNFSVGSYAQIHNESGSTETVTYSCVQGGKPDIGNRHVNPRFVDAAGGNVRLSDGSPCIDAGNNAAVPVSGYTDIDGNRRIADGNGDGNAIVDMGAYEFNSALPPHNITKSQSYPTIQAAIVDADNGDQIEVSPGTYYEAINFLGKAVRLYSSGGPDVTIINGTGHYHVVQCVSREGPDTILEGFTLTGGNANGPTDPDKRGGGMRIYLSSPTVIGCIFKNNVSDAHGGGMYIESGSPAPTVINCIFDGNMASDGGGMYSRNSSPTVVDCLFENNTTSLNGGGMYNFASRPTITHSSFLNNTANGTGGGMYSREQSHLTITHSTFSGNYAGGGGGAMVNTIYTHPKMTNCVFIGNTTPSRGGAIYNYFHSNPTITHCTFSRNTADDGGGGIYNNVNCTPTVVNSILWDNSPDPFLNVNSTPTVTYSTIQSDSLWPGDGNINADPLFVDAAGGNLRLGRSSPCIDAGNNAAVPAGVMTDLGGWPRFIDDPCTTDTGSGSGAIVDMGSHEFMPADIDDSGAVNLADFALLSALWQQSDGDLAGVDMNCDGVIDLADMMILATWWLEGK